MSFKSGINLKGDVRIEVRDRRGNLVEQRHVSNMIVDNGKELMPRLLVASFLNSQADNFYTAPIKAIAIGTGTGTPGPMERRNSLDTEVDRAIFDQVQINQASVDLKDVNNVVAVSLTCKLPGAYGNRVRIDVANGPYHITVTDENPFAWDGSNFSGPATPRDYSGADLGALLAAMSTDPVVAATAPDLAWSDSFASLPAGAYLQGGGTTLTVSATFTTNQANPVALVEAGLFTKDTINDPNDIMFNMVRFATINLSSDLDITFRWRISFSEP